MGGKSIDTTHSHDCQFHTSIMTRSLIILLLISVAVAGLEDGVAGQDEAGQGEAGQGQADQGDAGQGERGQHAERGRAATPSPLDISQDIDPDAEDEEEMERRGSNYENDPASVDFYFLPPLGNTSCWSSTWSTPLS